MAPDITGGELIMQHSPWFPRREYLSPGRDLAKEARELEARRTAPFVVIGYRNRKGTWVAIWTDKASRLGRFEGTREEVIAWARERCDDIRIISGPDGDHLYPRQLGPDDE
jgi:hypothetical protein